MTDEENTVSPEITDLTNSEIDSQLSRLESQVGRRTEEAPANEPPKGLTEERMRLDMERVWNRVNSPSSTPQMPALPQGSSIEDSITKSYEWIAETSPEDKKILSAFDQQKQAEDAALKSLGLTREEYEATKQTKLLEQQVAQAAVPQELAAPMQTVRELYGDQVSFHQAAAQYAHIDRLVRSNPVEGISQIIKNTGHDELEVLRALALKHNPAEIQQSFEQGRVQTIVDSFFEFNPDAVKFEEEILANIQRTGNPARDLKNAYEKARGERRGRSGKVKSLESRLRDAYDRMALR